MGRASGALPGGEPGPSRPYHPETAGDRMPPPASLRPGRSSVPFHDRRAGNAGPCRARTLDAGSQRIRLASRQPTRREEEGASRPRRLGRPRRRPEGSRSSARRQAEGGRCRKSVLARLIVPDRALLLPQFFPDGGDDVLDVAGILFGAGQIAQLAGLNDHADILAAGYREPELLRVHRFLAVRQGEIRRIFAERYGHDVLIMKFLGMLVEVGIAQKVEVGLVGAQV